MRLAAPAVLAVAAALALALPAAAQDATSGVAISIGTTDEIPHDGNATVPVTITIGCAAVLQHPDHGHMELTTDAPSWLNVTVPHIEFSAQDCLPPGNTAGFVTLPVNVVLTPMPDAPGVIPFNVNFTATYEEAVAGSVDPASDTQSQSFNITYRAGHTITPSLTFPHTMTGRTLTFNVTVNVTANARSMVMFENVRASPGTVSGLASDYYSPPETKVFTVTYTPPEGAWTEATISFHSFSHFLLDGPAAQSGGANLPADTTWTIRNGNPPSETTTSEEAPVSGVLLLPALVGAALWAGRRRA